MKTKLVPKNEEYAPAADDFLDEPSGWRHYVNKITSYIGGLVSAGLLAGILSTPVKAGECKVPVMEGCKNQVSYHNKFANKMEIYCELGKEGDHVQVFKAATYDCEKGFDIEGDKLILTYDPNTNTFVKATMRGEEILFDEQLTKMTDPLAIKLSKHYPAEQKAQVPLTAEEFDIAKDYPLPPTEKKKPPVDKAIEDLKKAEAVVQKIGEDYGFGTISYKDGKVIVKPKQPVDVDILYPSGKREKRPCTDTCEFKGPVDSIIITKDGIILGEYDVSDIAEQLPIGYMPGQAEIEISRFGFENGKFAGRGRFDYNNPKVRTGLEVVKDSQIGSGALADIEIKGPGIGFEGQYFGKEDEKTEAWSQTTTTEEGLTQDDWQNTNMTDRDEIWAFGLKFKRDSYSSLLRAIGNNLTSKQLSVGGSHIYGTIYYPIEEIGEVVEIPVDESVNLSSLLKTTSKWLGFYTQHDIDSKAGKFSLFGGYGETRNRTIFFQSVNGEESGFTEKDLTPLTIFGADWEGYKGKNINYFANMYTLQGQNMPENSKFNFNVGAVLPVGRNFVAFDVGQNGGNPGAGFALGFGANPAAFRRYQKNAIEYSILAGQFTGLPERMREFYLRDAFRDKGSIIEVRAREPSILGFRFGIGKDPIELQVSGEYGLSAGNLHPDTTYGRIGLKSKSFSAGLELENMRRPGEDVFFVGPYVGVKW